MPGCTQIYPSLFLPHSYQPLTIVPRSYAIPTWFCPSPADLLKFGEQLHYFFCPLGQITPRHTPLDQSIKVPMLGIHLCDLG